MYDISRRETFLHLSAWLQDARENGNPEMVVILVGNKSDLEGRRSVSEEEGRRFARDNGLLFFEASAKTSKNVEELFEEGSKAILKKIEDGRIDISNKTCGVRTGASTLSLQNKKSSSNSGCCSN